MESSFLRAIQVFAEGIRSHEVNPTAALPLPSGPEAKKAAECVGKHLLCEDRAASLDMLRELLDFVRSKSVVVIDEHRGAATSRIRVVGNK